MSNAIEVRAEVVGDVVNLAKSPDPAITYTLPVATVNNVAEIDAFVSAIESFFGDVQIDVYDDEQVKQLKGVRADINKVAGAIDKKRIAMNKEIKAATAEAESVLKDLHARVKAVYDKTGRQIEEADEMARQAKRNILEREYEGLAPDLMELIPLDAFIMAEPKLMQKSWSGAKACDVLADMVTKAVRNRQLLRDSNLEFYIDADKVFCQTLDVENALARNRQLSEERRERDEHQAASSRLDEAIGRAHEAVAANYEPEPVQAPEDPPIPRVMVIDAATTAQCMEIGRFCKSIGVTGSFKKGTIAEVYGREFANGAN